LFISEKNINLFQLKQKKNSLNASLITYKLSDESDWGTMQIYSPVDFRP